jgi:arylsulfatase A
VYEGGTRTPFITRWKGRIQPGVSDEIVCTVDLPASTAALSRQPLPDHGCLDSFNVLDALLGKPGAKGRTHLVQQDNGGSNLGLRLGNWKLVRQHAGPGSSKKGRTKGPGDQLFDLGSDPGEVTDLAKERPQELKRLQLELERILGSGRSRPVAQ